MFRRAVPPVRGIHALDTSSQLSAHHRRPPRNCVRSGLIVTASRLWNYLTTGIPPIVVGESLRIIRGGRKLRAL